MASSQVRAHRPLCTCLLGSGRTRLFVLVMVGSLLGLLLAAQGVRGSAPVEPASVPGVRMVSSSATGIVLEVTLPPDAIGLRSEEIEGQEYAAVSVAGWSTTADAGAPMLPVASAALGIPFGAGLSLRVVPGRVHWMPLGADVRPEETIPITLEAGALPAWSELPKPQGVTAQDPEIYGSSEAYPGVLAQVVSDGALRQQRIVGVAVYPVQYHPLTRQLEVYESLRVEVRFETGEGEPAPGHGQEESEGIERLLAKGLLNAGSAAQWRGQSTLPETSKGIPWAPPEPGYKIGAEQEGMYQVTSAFLAAAGLPVGEVDPRTFQLFVGGAEVAIYVAGESDGHFDPADYVLFYGNEIESKYTRTNVYWLTYGHGQGARMSSRDGTPSSGTVPVAYGESLHVEQNKFYVAALPGDDDLERFLWSYVYPPNTPSWSYTLSLPAPYSGGEGMATLRVAMFGYLSNAISPDHHTRLYVNGNLVEDAWWDGITWRYAQVEFPQSYLVSGDNTIMLSCPNDTGVGKDVVEIDWLELDFANGFVAVNDALSFSYDTPGDWKYGIDGFDTDALALFDITDSGAVQRIVGGSAIPSASGYLLQFRDAIAGHTRYQAVSQAGYLAPVSIEADTPSSLRSTLNGADYIIITHPAFAASFAALRDYRASQGLRAVEVDVTDVYDEFGYGVVGAHAIHDFLLYAYGYWQAPAPTYVLLVGDGHYDPKNYLGYGRTSYMPPYLATADPWLNETVSDNRYVTLTAGDTFPDMIIGRFPVNTSAEADGMVGKVLSYEQSPAAGDWNQDLLFAADNADEAGDFAAASDATIACCVPDVYQAEKVYFQVTHDTSSAARLAIIDGINAGKLIVHYVGHASNNVWASESLFSTVDIGSLANATKLPVMLPMTCYDGYFIYPHVDSGHSMAESLVRASGKGAVASWSPTGLGIQAGHEQLDHGFLSAVFSGSARDLGEATMAGKLKLWSYGAYLDLLDTYLLFGDPALQLNLLEADVGIEKSVEPPTPLQPDDVLTYTLTVVNAGPDLAFHVVISDEIPAFMADAEVVASSLDLSVRSGTHFSWDVQDLGPGEGGSITIRGRVDGTAGVGWFENHAQFSTGGREVGDTPNEDSALSQVLAGLPGLLQVTANPAEIRVGGSVATIRALVTDMWGNRVADGTVVTFSTDRGSLSPLAGVTQNGLVSSSLTSGDLPGVATVSVAASDAQGSVEVVFVPGEPAGLDLTALPLQIPVGGATSQVTALVHDLFGNLVADGTLVAFATTRGTIAPVSVPTVDGKAQATLISGSMVGAVLVTAQAGGASDSVNVLFVPGAPSHLVLATDAPSVPAGGQTGLAATVTDNWGNSVADGTLVSFATDLGSVSPATSPTASGKATTAFLGGTVAGQASITASAGDASGAAVVPVLPGSPGALSVTATPESIPLDGTSTIEAHVTDQYGNPVADGTHVSFASTLGVLDPSSAGTSGGTAVSVLQGGTQPGLATVTAVAGSVSGLAQVTISDGVPVEIILTALPGQIVADGASSSTITALVLDAWGQPITQTIPISFATTLGQVDPPTAWVVDGQAVTQLSGTQAGIATVTAQAADTSAAAAVELLSGPAALLVLTATPAEVPLQGQSAVSALVTDQFGNLVADGTLVQFAGTLGGMMPTSAETVAGVAQSTFTAGSVAGDGMISVEVGSASGSAPITVLPGPAAMMALEAVPAVVEANGADCSVITSGVFDAQGNPVADGTEVVIATTRGTLDPEVVLTQGGWAQTTLTAGTVAGVAVVTAASGSAVATAQVVFTPGAAAVVGMGAVPAGIPADGESQSTVVAEVTDAFGNAVADGTWVAFGTDLGSVSPSSVATQGGLAHTLLTAGTQAGTAVVTALVGTLSGSVQVALEPGAASAIHLAAEPGELVADGSSTALVTATVTDSFGNPVVDGTLVHFSSSLGSVAPLSSVTGGGAATATFQAGLTLGLAQVSAWSGAAAGQTEIALVPGVVAHLLVTANPGSIVADGHSTSVISTHALDAWGHDVADGTPLRLATTLGSMNPTSGVTMSGWFTTTLQAGTEDGTAVITARSGDVVGTTSVEFRSGLLYLPLITRAWVPPVTDLSITGTGPSEAAVWDTLQYTITYTNSGDIVICGVVITDVLPAGVRYVADSSGVSPQVVSPRTYVWEVHPGDLQPGEGHSFEVTVTVGYYEGIGAELVNTASIGAPGVRETIRSNNESTWTTPVLLPDPAMVKTGPAAAHPGDTIVYTLDFYNLGDGVTDVVVITDTLPVGATYVSDTANAVPSQPVAGTFVWTLWRMAPRQLSRFKVTVLVGDLADTGPTMLNTAEIGAASPNLVPGNDVSQWATAIQEGQGHLGDPIARQITHPLRR